MKIASTLKGVRCRIQCALGSCGYHESTAMLSVISAAGNDGAQHLRLTVGMHYHQTGDHSGKGSAVSAGGAELTEAL